MKQKVWLVGGNGLVGQELKEVLNKSFHNFECHSLSRNELDIYNLPQNLPFDKNDYLIDLVPPPYVRDVGNLNSHEYHAMNTEPHKAFITAALKAGISKYIFISSGGAIYGRSTTKTPFREDEKVEPVSFYGESKLIQENHLIEESKKYSAKSVILRPSNIFNINFEHGLQKGLIGVFLQRFRSKTPLEVFGSTSITKDYISNRDVAYAIISAISFESNGIFNIGSGITYSIQEIIEAFEKKFNYKATIIHKPFNEQDVDWFALDISKAIISLSFKAKDDLIDCISSSTIQQS